MLKIKNVTAKNFMSVGNNTQAVGFDTDSLTLVLGHNLDLGGDGSRNGTGKSTLGNILAGKDNYNVHSGDIIYKDKSIVDLSPDENNACRINFDDDIANKFLEGEELTEDEIKLCKNTGFVWFVISSLRASILVLGNRRDVKKDDISWWFSHCGCWFLCASLDWYVRYVGVFFLHVKIQFTKIKDCVCFLIYISPNISSPIFEEPINFMSKDIVTEILFFVT